jgi:hypothetical protein
MSAAQDALRIDSDEAKNSLRIETALCGLRSV